ncbi:MAG TPA: A/G-specific adenine glycosylase [Phycisphaerae bacterium]|nr:A/G-specific adenine glycosylase [Phycisphaerae bacterium]
MTPDAKYRRWIRSTLLGWYGRCKRDLPWRRINDPYAIWLSEVMLQQTQVATVIPYYERFRSRFLTVQDLAEADLQEVLRLWAGLGYYARARNLHRTARRVVQDFGGRFPETAAELRRLPGVGRYIAGAVASMAFEERAPVVDGNVVRVLARLFGSRQNARTTAGREAFWRLAEVLLPETRCGDFNQALMELGATVCLPGRAARCEACPLQKKCVAYATEAVIDLPNKPAKRAVKCETHIIAAIGRSGRWLFVRRPARGLWGGLWEMPSAVLDCKTTAREAARIARTTVASPAWAIDPQPFCDFRHQLTHRTIRLVGHVCRVRSGGNRRAAVKARALGPRAPEEQTSEPRWLPLEKAGLLGLSRAMQKVIAMLQASLATSPPVGKLRRWSPE